MRLAVVGPMDSVHTQRWVSHFSNSHEIYTFTGHLPSKMYDLDSVGRSRIRHLLRVTNLRGSIRKVNPDILHAHYAVTYGFYSALSGFHPYIISIWGSDVLIAPKMYGSILKRVVNYSLSKADVIHTDSHYATNLVTTINEKLREKVQEIPWGVDVKKFELNTSKEKLRQHLDIPEDKTVIISMRSLESIYDPYTQIAAAEQLKNKGRQSFLWLICGGGSLKPQLTEMIKTKNLEENIRLVGRVDPSLVPEYFAAADIYVNTSLSDTISIALLEAMSCKLPAVTTDVGAHSEWIQNGDGGYIIGKQDATALAQQTEHLMNDNGLRRKFGEKNLQLVKEKGDWNKNMEKIEKIYENLLDKTSSNASLP